MKIVFCVEFYYPSVGGCQELVRQIAKNLVAMGHDVWVATTQLPERNCHYHEGVHIASFNIKGNQVRGMTGEIGAYQNFLRNSQADIILFYAAQNTTCDAALPILNALPGKKILAPCGYSALYAKKYQPYFHALKKYLPLFDATIYHGREYRDFTWNQVLGLKNMVVIPNGADLEAFQVKTDNLLRDQYAVNRDALVFMTVGSLTPSKGHLTLLRAFEHADFQGREALLILNASPLSRVKKPKTKIESALSILSACIKRLYSPPLQERAIFFSNPWSASIKTQQTKST